MQHFLIVVESGNTNYSAFSPDVLGCAATGLTVEQTLAEMRSALVAHFEEMLEVGEPLPEPKGLEHYIRSGEYVADPGDLITTIDADELFAKVAAGASAH